jgi:hypothetical protein
MWGRETRAKGAWCRGHISVRDTASANARINGACHGGGGSKALDKDPCFPWLDGVAFGRVLDEADQDALECVHMAGLDCIFIRIPRQCTPPSLVG